MVLLILYFGVVILVLFVSDDFFYLCIHVLDVTKWPPLG